MRSGKITRQTDWLFLIARETKTNPVVVSIAFQRVATHGAMSTSGGGRPSRDRSKPATYVHTTDDIESPRATQSSLAADAPSPAFCDVCFLNRASCFACRRPATASGSRDTRVAMLFDDRALTHTSLPAPSSSPDDHDAQVRGGRGAAAGGSRRARSVAARGLRVGRVRARAARLAPREERVARCLRGLGERRRGLVGRRRRRAG